MAQKIFKAPDSLRNSDPTGFCPGCGHGIAGRLGFEVLDEMGLLEKSIFVDDVCGLWIQMASLQLTAELLPRHAA